MRQVIKLEKSCHLTFLQYAVITSDLLNTAVSFVQSHTYTFNALLVVKLVAMQAQQTKRFTCRYIHVCIQLPPYLDIHPHLLSQFVERCVWMWRGTGYNWSQRSGSVVGHDRYWIFEADANIVEKKNV